jgi:hypothetical protein
VICSSKKPAHHAQRNQHEKHDQRDRGDRRGQRQKGYQDWAAKLHSRSNGLPRPPVRTVECALRIPVIPCVSPAMPPRAITAAIGGASIMTAADRSSRRRKRRGSPMCRAGCRRPECNRPGLLQQRHAEDDEGLRRPEPGETIVQMKVSCVGRATANEHRQKHAETSRSGERDAEHNG